MQLSTLDFISKDHVGGLTQASPKTEDGHRIQGNAADNLGQPASGTDRQSCKGVSKATESLY